MNATAALRVLPMGDRALLLEVGSLTAVLSLHDRLQASVPAGVIALVPAARTVLVEVDTTLLPLAAARAWIADVIGTGDAADPAEAFADDRAPVVLPIRYDGADLSSTALLLGITPESLIAAHLGAPWRVAFTGFAPGFGYLVSDGWAFDVPRLESPRTRVPSGAVGIAGEFTGAYPRETPGGWRLIGTTDARLFDPAADPPALLAPGTAVRFEEAP